MVESESDFVKIPPTVCEGNLQDIEYASKSLRRLRIHFPHYGAGFLYIVLRDLNFDCCETLDVLRDLSKLPKHLSSIPKSTSLQTVKCVMMNEARKQETDGTCKERFSGEGYALHEATQVNAADPFTADADRPLQKSKECGEARPLGTTPSYPQHGACDSEEESPKVEQQRLLRRRRYRVPVVPLIPSSDSDGSPTKAKDLLNADTSHCPFPTSHLKTSAPSISLFSTTEHHRTEVSPVISATVHGTLSPVSSHNISTTRPSTDSQQQIFNRKSKCSIPSGVNETSLSLWSSDSEHESASVASSCSHRTSVDSQHRSLYNLHDAKALNNGTTLEQGRLFDNARTQQSPLSIDAPLSDASNREKKPITIRRNSLHYESANPLLVTSIDTHKTFDDASSDTASSDSFHDALSEEQDACTVPIVTESSPQQLPADDPQTIITTVLARPSADSCSSPPPFRPRHIHEGRRRIALLDDTDRISSDNIMPREFPSCSSQFTTVKPLNRLETSETIPQKLQGTVSSKRVDGRLENASAQPIATGANTNDDRVVQKPATCPVSYLQDNPYTSIPMEGSQVFPYTSALDGYLRREEELLRSSPATSVLTAGQDNRLSPAPEVCGFKWWSEKRRFYRNALGSTYLRPRHRFLLGPNVYNALYEYQKASVAWMFELFKERRGGILADEMGLGKTVQATVFLRGLFSSRLATHAIILLPLTLLAQWKSHLAKWCPDAMVCVYHGTKSERRVALDTCFGAPPNSCAVLLTTYETFRLSCKQLCRVEFGSLLPDERAESKMIHEAARNIPPEFDENDEDCVWRAQLCDEVRKDDQLGSRPWDVVIMDEAHKIKNPSNQSAQAARLLYAHCRLLMTGTPVTNSLDELWSLMDCAQPGLLGNHRTFKREFADPIKLASTRAASDFVVARKNRISLELRRLVTPYFLRRTVADTLTQHPSPENSNKASSDPDGQNSGPSTSPCDEHNQSIPRSLPSRAGDRPRPQEVLPAKTDVAVWIRLTASQEIIYEAFLASRHVKDIFRHSTHSQKGFNSMQAVGILLKLCRHPALLLPRELPAWWRTKRTAAQRLTEDNESAPNNVSTVSLQEQAEPSLGVEASLKSQAWFQHVVRLALNTPEELRFCSGKLTFLHSALPSFLHHQHRCLIFSQSTQMLDIIQAAVMDPLQLRYLRIDGSVPVDIRQARIKMFQDQTEIFALLMTTKVGGQGLNLTCADRVVIVDPDWTPANDNQAVARIYRLGQTKEVKVYRLFTAGAIEDHAFRLQTFKQGLSKVALDCAHQKAYFTEADMKKIFTLRTDGVSETMKILEAVDPERQSERDVFESIVKEDLGEECHAVLAEDLLVGLSDFDALYRELSGTLPINEKALQNADATVKSAVELLKGEAYGQPSTQSATVYRRSRITRRS